MIGAGGTGAFDGVNQSSGQDSIVVRNGAIRNWARHGVNLTDSFPETNRVVGILASGNKGTGIFVLNGCLVTNCQTYFNLGDGISAGAGSIVSNCTARSNQGRGIVVTQFATVADCTASANNLDGIQGDSSNVIRGNTCKAGGSAAGIRVTGNGNRIEGNHSASGVVGISVGSFGNLVIQEHLHRKHDQLECCRRQRPGADHRGDPEQYDGDWRHLLRQSRLHRSKREFHPLGQFNQRLSRARQPEAGLLGS